MEEKIKYCLYVWVIFVAHQQQRVLFDQLLTIIICSQNFDIDSAGTHAYHIGNSPDQRAQQAAIDNGVDLSSQRARQVHESDFYYYDYIIAMDSDNLERLKSMCPEESHSKIELMLDYSKEYPGASVPDPYYEGKFDEVFKMVHSACLSFFESIEKKTNIH